MRLSFHRANSSAFARLVVWVAWWMLGSLHAQLAPVVTTNARQLLVDPGFERVPSGALNSAPAGGGWEVQRVGREAIQRELRIDCVADRTRSRGGDQLISVSLPRDTIGFEFVTVGQRVRLAAGFAYEASVWVRWPDGPVTKPVGATATSGHPSAIVSFWARHGDNTAEFAGRDEWLFDREWHRLSFRFLAHDPLRPTFVYVSLLPNQAPAATTVVLDDFELHEMRSVPERDERGRNLVLDGEFRAQGSATIPAGAIVAPPWHFSQLGGGTGITARLVPSDESHFLTLAMPAATSNFQSAQLWQHIDLRTGVRYEVSCRLRWDNFSTATQPPIVNLGIYHEESRTWYGPVDQVLHTSGEWSTYRFTHVPAFSGRWKLYVQLNGWGNFGRAVTVSFDDFSCNPSL